MYLALVLPLIQTIELASIEELQSSQIQAQASFGSSVAVVPDLDGDGVADFAVGADREDLGEDLEDAGAVYVFSSATRNVLHRVVSPTPTAAGFFGVSVAGIEDLDGDGAGEILVGTYSEWGGGAPVSSGRAHLFSGASGNWIRSFISPNQQGFAYFGKSVAAIPDVNGDGKMDLLIGAHGENLGPGLQDAGRAYVFSGATGNLIRTLVSPFPEAFGLFGYAVCGIEDLDQDGRGDALIGARLENPGTTPIDAGRAYVFSAWTGTVIRSIGSPNEEGNGQFGFSTAVVPDTDGDGLDEILVGAYLEDSNHIPQPPPNPPPAPPEDVGRAYLFSGSTGKLLRTFESENEENSGQFAYSVCGVPDVDGDGFGDILIAAHQENLSEELESAGRAYLFSGSTGLLLHVLTSPHRESFGSFGFALASAPDLDGDGAGEILVSASGEKISQTELGAGRAYFISCLVDSDNDGVGDPCDQCPGFDDTLDADFDGIPNDCDPTPFPEIIASNPPNGIIDARQPSPITGGAAMGFQQIQLTFSGNGVATHLLASDLAVSEEGGDGVAPNISAIEALDPNVALVSLSAPVQAGAWTRIRYILSGSEIRFGYLPADVNGDGYSAPMDILYLINYFNGVVSLPIWSADINRNGLAHQSDILRVVDLLNGADAFDPWIGRTLP